APPPLPSFSLPAALPISDRFITAREVDIGMGKSEVEVVHSHTPQHPEVRAGAVHSREHPAPPEGLGPLPEDRSRRERRAHRRATLEPEGRAAARRADWKAADAGADRAGEEADDGGIARNGGRDEVRAMDLDVLRIV